MHLTIVYTKHYWTAFCTLASASMKVCSMHWCIYLLVCISICLDSHQLYPPYCITLICHNHNAASVQLSLSLCLCLSHLHFLITAVSLTRCFTGSHTLSLSLSVCVSVSVCLSQCLSLSFSVLSVCLFHSVLIQAFLFLPLSPLPLLCLSACMFF